MGYRSAIQSIGIGVIASVIFLFAPNALGSEYVYIDDLDHILGEPIKEVEKELSSVRRKTSDISEGNKKILVGYVCSGKEVSILSDNGAISMVIVDSAEWVTRKGVSVGDRFRKVKSVYPNGRLSYGISEGEYLYFISDEIYFDFETIIFSPMDFRKDSLSVEDIEAKDPRLKRIFISK